MTEAAVALTPGTVIGLDVLDLLLESPAEAPLVDPAAGSMRLEHAIRHHIRRVMQQVGGNKRRAARELGLARATLERRLKDM